MADKETLRQHLPVYFVTGLAPVGGRSALETVAQALDGGVTIVQLREKEAPLSRIMREGAALRELCRRSGVPFIVNDRVDVALLLDADGVHVGQDDLPCAMVRQLVGPERMIGVSAKTREEAAQAAADGADYIGVGPIFATATKPDAGDAIGTSLLRYVRRELGLPQVGIGGIDAANAADVIASGADGIAVVSAIAGSDDPREAAARLRSIAAAAEGAKLV
ncbi:thiamine phosphate synthase [Paenibacillus cymbidii]|uniref:thiamine phosphate synthase n=1 Tax=Paenibacillus cymbidii TaxID=1639034 RepID=UPI001082260C|nr:thiamine phosphate synthase [Paenibacillus cymbidii]